MTERVDDDDDSEEQVGADEGLYSVKHPVLATITTYSRQYVILQSISKHEVSNHC